MTSKELIKKIRRIEIISNKLAEEIFSGEYRSGFRGRGMEFEDIREYYPGDDVRNIDWNVTARHNKAYIKQFEEERELNVFLLIDMSHSNSFGKKMELIAQLGATLAFSAIRNNDKVGMLLFTEKVEKYIQSKSGKKHVLSIIENILDFKPELKGTNLSNALQHFNRIEKKRSVIFLISDFLDQGFEKDLKGFLRIWWLAHIRTGAAWDRLTARRIYVYDVDFPPIGVLNLNEILFNRGARGEGARDARIATQLGLPLGFSI